VSALVKHAKDGRATIDDVERVSILSRTYVTGRNRDYGIDPSNVYWFDLSKTEDGTNWELDVDHAPGDDLVFDAHKHFTTKPQTSATETLPRTTLNRKTFAALSEGATQVLEAAEKNGPVERLPEPPEIARS
jgi:hypothetical protein